MQVTVKQQQYVDVYDRYTQSDFKYGDQASTNLNPRREVKPKTRNIYVQIQDRLQKMTDDIIRTQLQPPLEEPIFNGPLGGEFIQQESPRRIQALMRVGGRLFPTDDTTLERHIGTFPTDEIDIIDLPPTIDCEQILNALLGEEEQASMPQQNESAASQLNIFKQMNNINNTASNPNKIPQTTDNSETNQEEDTPDELTDPNDPNNFDYDDQDFEDYNEDFEAGDDVDDTVQKLNEMLNNCPKINLTWLVILLIILEVIKALQQIVDFVLSIIKQVMFVIQLQVGQWLNPVNIEQIKLFIMQLIVAIIIQIITLIIQQLWNLLNLDCLCDQTKDLLDKLRNAIKAFTSLMSLFNPSQISLLNSKIDMNILNPLASLQQTIEGKQDQWQSVGQQVSDLLTNPATQQGIIDGIQSGVQSGLLSQNANQVGKVNGIVSSAEGLLTEQDKLNQLDALTQTPGTIDSGIQAASQQSGVSSTQKLMMSPQFMGMKIKIKQ